ncbi:MAG TPA: hypothetical protein VIT23_01620, partial [Terrimicrobiaceae bacterium]
LLRSENLGCKEAVSSAITWFFDHEPEGIILEDDCLPSPAFFWFCQELLARFRDDERIWQICGSAVIEGRHYSQIQESYIFSRFGSIWGWASWRRAWAYYDANMSDWLSMRRPQLFNSVYRSYSQRRFLLDIGNKLHKGEFDTWDYQWDFTKAYQSGLCIIPSNNMVVNIGFGPGATHTLKPRRWVPLLKTDRWRPITHPRYVVVNENHDLLYRRKVLLGSTSERAKRAVKNLLKGAYKFYLDNLTGMRSGFRCIHQRFNGASGKVKSDPSPTDN